MNILVCGSSGFIGTHLVKFLYDNGHEVVGLDLVEPGNRNGLIDFSQGDILVKDDVRKALQGIDCVINLAAKHHDCGITEEEYFETNETGSRRLLECMTEGAIEKYIFYSSVAVYGQSISESDEATEPRPGNPYGASKLAAEKVAYDWADEKPDRQVLIIRPSVVYGEGNFANMFSLIKMIDKGRYFQFGCGEAVKSLCYVRNLTKATGYCMDRMETGVELFNYVDKDDLPVKQTVAIIADELGKKVQPISYPLWVGVAVAKVFELAGKVTGKNSGVSAARVKKLATPTRFGAQKIKDYGFVPEYTIEEGLRNMVSWYMYNTSRNWADDQGAFVDWLDKKPRRRVYEEEAVESQCHVQADSGLSSCKR